MKTNTKVSSRGFTLIEMVGVLAVIAILAALLVPKIFAVINDSRLNGAVTAVNTVKTATMGYFGKVGNFSTNNANFGTNLLGAGVMDSAFITKVGTNNTIEVVSGLPAATPPTGKNGAYKLDANTTVANDATGSKVVQAVINGVAIKDAIEISMRIDGAGATEADETKADLLGRVVYVAAVGNLVDLYIYIADK